jgi:hypothetical protein
MASISLSICSSGEHYSEGSPPICVTPDRRKASWGKTLEISGGDPSGEKVKQNTDRVGHKRMSELPLQH